MGTKASWVAAYLSGTQYRVFVLIVAYDKSAEAIVRWDHNLSVVICAEGRLAGATPGWRTTYSSPAEARYVLAVHMEAEWDLNGCDHSLLEIWHGRACWAVHAALEACFFLAGCSL